MLRARGEGDDGHRSPPEMWDGKAAERIADVLDGW
jgi:hypothetical protein